MLYVHYLIKFSDSPWRFGHYYPHLTDKETEVEKNEVTSLSHNGANGRAKVQVKFLLLPSLFS